MTAAVPAGRSYLLDTDAVSYLLRDRPPPRLVSRLTQTPAGAQSLSSITLGELLYGAHRNPGKSALLLRLIEELLTAGFRIVSFDEPAARRYGSLRAELERSGQPIGDADTRIAAIALANDLTLVTGNIRHFERVPDLRVANWLV